ncbi:MAG: phosphatidate cytidylyltransferase [Saprospiraceae bacterium]|nr:phosphatidate cytidylyltransferase [Saprospiraceae bacterium]
MSFKQRAITGLTFVGVMIGLTLAHPLACAILFFLVAALCIYEFSGLILVQDGSSTTNLSRRILAMTVGLYLPLIALIQSLISVSPTSLVIYGVPITLFLFSSLFLFELFGKSAQPFPNIGFSFLGMFYIGLPLSLVIGLSTSIPQGNFLVLSILFMIWAGDTGAYMLGSQIGKNKMFPRISPGKTWEGTMGGVASAIIVAVLCSLVFKDIPLQLWQWMILGAICAVFGILGDLVESMLKRSLGIKDSGNILPGHGGFLDRFDSFIFVIPFIAIALFFFTMLR